LDILIKKLAKRYLPQKSYDSFRNQWRKVSSALSVKSINKAVIEQGLSDLSRKLENIVPNISDQYTNKKIDNNYLYYKVRAQHSFQMSLVKKAFEMPALKSNDTKLSIVDIGDSSGTHLRYIKGLWPEKNMRTVSVNMDDSAVRKIRQNGLEAVCSRAEDIDKYNINPDIILSFQMLEHMMNPIHFLHKISEKSNCICFVLTVPYVRNSRLGLHRIFNNPETPQNAENTHILELSPKDWRELFQFSGWRVEYDSVYLQYPRRDILHLMKPYWRRFDLEGFYGAILVKDDKWSRLYRDWN